MKDHKYTCPKCQFGFEVEWRFGAQTIKCPKCDWVVAKYELMGEITDNKMTPTDYADILKVLNRFQQIIDRWENNYHAKPNDKRNLSLAKLALERNKP